MNKLLLLGVLAHNAHEQVGTYQLSSAVNERMKELCVVCSHSAPAYDKGGGVCHDEEDLMRPHASHLGSTEHDCMEVHRDVLRSQHVQLCVC
jgi:hypothetical protein